MRDSFKGSRSVSRKCLYFKVERALLTAFLIVDGLALAFDVDEIVDFLALLKSESESTSLYAPL